MSDDHRFDQTAVKQYAAIYRAPKIAARRKATMDVLDLKVGEHVLDIGFGPGYFSSELADIVGPQGKVAGIDFSRSMLDIASAICDEKPQINLQVGDAKQLPYPDASFDAAIAVQVYDYIDDVPLALSELHRVLKPKGRAVIADTDWGTQVWHATDKVRMAKFQEVLKEHFAQPHLPRHLLPMLKDAGFTVKNVDGIVMMTTEIEPYVMGITKLAGQFIAGRHGITVEDIQEWEADLSRLDEIGEYFYSANQYLFLIEKS